MSLIPTLSLAGTTDSDTVALTRTKGMRTRRKTPRPLQRRLIRRRRKWSWRERESFKKSIYIIAMKSTRRISQPLGPGVMVCITYYNTY